ncbi:MAG: SDR family NAD(P)-dependent oxidoreductase [Gammaproteobacteria bacterium]
MLDLNGRIAVITGGASGIGAACAAALEREGVRVARWDMADGPGVIGCDVADAAAVANAIDRTVARYGPPTLLVAAAGVADGHWIVDMEPAAWDRVLGVNLRGVMLSVQAVARTAIAAGSNGSMVLISSVNGVVADPGLSAYSASKAAVYHFARVAARELGPHGIRINAVGPGPTETPMLRGALDLPGYREEILRRTPLGEVGTPERIAEAVTGLMKMEWVTGQALMVDGGASLTTGRGVWKTPAQDDGNGT